MGISTSAFAFKARALTWQPDLRGGSHWAESACSTAEGPNPSASRV